MTVEFWVTLFALIVVLGGIFTIAYFEVKKRRTEDERPEHSVYRDSR